MIHHCNREAFIILVLFAVYTLLSFFFSKYLGLAKHHSSSDILVPFPDSSDLYSRVGRFVLFFGYGFKEICYFIFGFRRCGCNSNQFRSFLIVIQWIPFLVCLKNKFFFFFENVFSLNPHLVYRIFIRWFRVLEIWQCLLFCGSCMKHDSWTCESYNNTFKNT